MKQPTRLAIAIILAFLTIIGLHNIAHYHHKVEIQKIELKSSQLKARTLELEYDQALHQLDNKSATEQQLKDAQDKLNQLEQQKQQLEQQLQARAAQKQAGAVAYAASLPSYSTSGDPYLDWIFQHESSGNPYAINPIGACGLGQALPCAKLLAVCGSLANVDCQVGYFKNYCITVYGSTYNAYQFWLAHNWY